MTVMPRSIAFFSAGTSASVSLADTAMALTFWAISELMTSIWPSAVAVGRAGIDDLDVAEFLGGFLRALVGGLEEADAERLHHQRDLHGSRRMRGTDEHGGGDRRGRQQVSSTMTH